MYMLVNIYWRFTIYKALVLAISHLGFYLSNWKMRMSVQWFENSQLHSKKQVVWMFIETLFIAAPNWKQPRCPSIGEWINKLRYIHIMKYYSRIKINKLSQHENTWMNPKYILISERSQSERAIYFRVPVFWHYVKSKTRDGKKISDFRVWRGGQCWIGEARKILGWWNCSV